MVGVGCLEPDTEALLYSDKLKAAGKEGVGRTDFIKEATVHSQDLSRAVGPSGGPASTGLLRVRSNGTAQNLHHQVESGS